MGAFFVSRVKFCTGQFCWGLAIICCRKSVLLQLLLNTSCSSLCISHYNTLGLCCVVSRLARERTVATSLCLHRVTHVSHLLMLSSKGHPSIRRHGNNNTQQATHTGARCPCAAAVTTAALAERCRRPCGASLVRCCHDNEHLARNC